METHIVQRTADRPLSPFLKLSQQRDTICQSTQPDNDIRLLSGMSGTLKNRDNVCVRGLAASLFLFLSSLPSTAADFNLPSAPSVSLIRGSNSTAIIYAGETNFQYTLYGSSNLVAWTGLTTNLCLSPQMTFSESNRLTRFFRPLVRRLPLFTNAPSPEATAEIL